MNLFHCHYSQCGGSRWELPLPPSCEVENKNVSAIHTHRVTLVSTPSQAGMSVPH